MSEFCRNKRSMTLALSAFFLAVTILAGSVAYLFTDNGMGNIVAELSESSSSSAPPESSAAEDADETDEADDADDIDDNGEAAEEANDIAEEIDAPRHYNVPSEMRGVFLTPGEDFLVGGTDAASVKKEIDNAIASAKKLTMNSVIIDTVYGSSVIYETSGSPDLAADFDIMGYAVEKAREAGLYAYAIFDVSFYDRTSTGATMLSIGAGSSDALAGNLREFAEKYELDGILIDGYINKQTPQSYGMYMFLGSGIGYDNFMRQSPKALMATASKTVRKYSSGTQVGLLADAVWENNTANEDGSATNATFTSLGSGNADTRAFLMEGLVDFVAVKAYSATSDKAEPFETVVKWWAGAAGEAGVPMYAVHASSKACTDNTGWQEQEQLMRQVIALEGIGGARGSMFNSLSRLNADPKGVTTTLIKYYNEEVEPEHILTQLEVTKPSSLTYTTSEPVVTFAGASDPNSPVTINGEPIQTDSNGYFTLTRDLEGGQNVFKIAHKDRSVTYTITREIEILKDISPMGKITADGSMSINITALAYADATVYAVVNGTNISMSIDEGAEDESARDSNYRTFSGQYTTPSPSAEVQNLGNIVVYAEWDGVQKSIEGADVKVNKKVKIEDGVPVVVVADQAKTYPPNTLDNIPDARYYPLPRGAMDYAVSDEIVYKKGSDTYTYFVLASGMRVESGDISSSSDFASGNSISGMSVSSESGYTYVTVKTAQKVSYSFAYSGDGISICFSNTTSVPDSASVASNAIFSAASWSGGDTLNLSFVKSGGFMGYKGYYNDNGDLVFRFNNPPSSISGARIAIDPGHGGKDYGALGFLADYPEKVINLAIAQLLADDLESRGAKVLLLNTSGGMELKERVRQAEEFGADMFVSVHCNTAPNAKATGTEVYYFYPYAKNLAANASANVSSRLGTTNRGARQSYYHVTLSSQVPSVLVECGFLSNQAEYERLIKSKNQAAIAAGIADSIAAAIKAASTGYSESATKNTATDAKPTEDKKPEEVTPDADTKGEESKPSTSSPSGQNKVAVEGVFLSFDQMLLSVGEDVKLTADVLPTSAGNKNVTWRSGNASVATVNASGKVTAIAEGTAKITVTTEDGGYKATCEVEVVPAEDGEYIEPSEPSSATTVKAGKDNSKVEDVDINNDEVDLEAGETLALKLLTYPSSVKDVTVSWSSSNSSVAKVDANGKVTAVSDGSCRITGKVVDTNLSMSCNVYVTGSSSSETQQSGQGVGLSGVTEIYFEEDITLLVNKKATLVLESDKGVVNNTKVKWKSSDTSVATVNSDGVVQAKAKTGTVTITAYTDVSDLYATCYVNVTNQKTAAETVTLNKTEITVAKGSTYKNLTATVSPSNATMKGIRWVSSNDRIAKVDSNGVITGVSRGTCTIAAISEENSRVRASCKVEVVNELVIEWIEFDMDSLGILVGEEDILYLTIYPDIGSENLIWESSAPQIVSVDQTGKVKGLKEGTAIIKVRAKNDSSIWAECEVGVAP